MKSFTSHLTTERQQEDARHECCVAVKLLPTFLSGPGAHQRILSRLPVPVMEMFESAIYAKPEFEHS